MIKTNIVISTYRKVFSPLYTTRFLKNNIMGWWGSPLGKGTCRCLMTSVQSLKNNQLSRVVLWPLPVENVCTHSENKIKAKQELSVILRHIVSSSLPCLTTKNKTKQQKRSCEKKLWSKKAIQKLSVQRRRFSVRSRLESKDRQTGELERQVMYWKEVHPAGHEMQSRDQSTKTKNPWDKKTKNWKYRPGIQWHYTSISQL